MRRVVALLVVLTLAAGLVALTGSSSLAVPPDRSMDRRECALAGRVFEGGAGCSRTRCVQGAVRFKLGRDAELCARLGRNGAAYGQPINAGRCRALGRVWIDEINICASNPDRSDKVIARAPQCTNPRATYVNHSEEEGYFDECLAPAKARRLERAAKREKVSLASIALERGRANCSYRPGWVLRDKVCGLRQGPPPASELGGVFMSGDSVSWRAWEELHRRVDWELDLRPGRRFDELAGRLDWYRANHGDPARVIIQLGTNRRTGYDEQDFRDTMDTIAPGTPVMMLLPYRTRNADNAGLVAATKSYVAWMRSYAAERADICLADWPRFAAKNLDKLVDGEHPGRGHEDWYARYVVRSWGACAKKLGI